MIRTETNGMMQERVIHLGQSAHPAGVEPTAERHSIGRWEGGTLVIDTVGLAASRIPNVFSVANTADLHLVEKSTLAQDRRDLEYEFTVDLPPYLDKPATFHATWDYRLRSALIRSRCCSWTS